MHISNFYYFKIAYIFPDFSNILQSLVKVKSIEICIVSRSLYREACIGICIVSWHKLIVAAQNKIFIFLLLCNLTDSFSFVLENSLFRMSL